MIQDMFHWVFAIIIVTELEEQLSQAQRKLEEESSKPVVDEEAEAAHEQQVSDLQNKINEYEDTIRQLSVEVTKRRQTQDSLISVTQSLASLYHLLCEANNETPSRYTDLPYISFVFFPPLCH